MRIRLFYACLLAVISAAPAAAQDFSWRKVVPAGKAIEIKGVIGDISATPASGNQVEVVAHKSARRSDPASVEIKVVEHAEGVTICAIYEDDNDCDAGANGNSSSYENDTHVDFEVRVPRGVLFTGRTVIGDIEARDLSADVDASSVTGNVRVTTTGLVYASSVSGSLFIRMGRTDWSNTLSFTTVSGDIELELPADLNSAVSFSTVSGDLDSDWPMQIGQRTRNGRINGTIGSGGRKLSFSTVSGDVELRKIN
jgi:hypothetical protein